MLSKEVCETVLMNFDDLRNNGSGLYRRSNCGKQNYDITQVIERFAHFYKHESCGQCILVERVAGWMLDDAKTCKREISPEQLELLENVTKQIEGHTICALGDAAAWPIQD